MRAMNIIDFNRLAINTRCPSRLRRQKKAKKKRFSNFTVFYTSLLILLLLWLNCDYATVPYRLPVSLRTNVVN